MSLASRIAKLKAAGYPEEVAQRIASGELPQGGNIMGVPLPAVLAAGTGIAALGDSEEAEAAKFYRGDFSGLSELKANPQGILFASTDRSGAFDTVGRQVYDFDRDVGKQWSPENAQDLQYLLDNVDKDLLYEQYSDPDLIGTNYYKEIGKKETLEEWEDGLRYGAYQSVEMPAVLQALRDGGYDSFQIAEDHQTKPQNVGFFMGAGDTIPLLQPEKTVKALPPLLAAGTGIAALGASEQSEAGGLPPDMYRADGSEKSALGYLGPIKNNVTGKTMTELTVGVPINGEEMEVPAMVPTLTEDEILFLQNNDLEGRPQLIPESIVRKAQRHAVKRLGKGQSVFYQDGEDGRMPAVKLPREQTTIKPIDMKPTSAPVGSPSFFSTAKEMLTPEMPTPENVLGRIEAAATIASSIPAFGLGVVKLLGDLGQGQSPQEALQTYRQISEELTYMPRPPAGMEKVQAIGELLAPLGRLYEAYGEKVGEKTGSPLTGEYFEEFVDPLMVFPALKGVGALATVPLAARARGPGNPRSQRNKIVAPVNAFGLYSRAQNTAMQMPQAVNNGQDAYRFFKKNGVKDREMEELGLLDLFNQQTVTQQEILEQIEAQGITLDERVSTGDRVDGVETRTARLRAEEVPDSYKQALIEDILNQQVTPGEADYAIHLTPEFYQRYAKEGTVTGAPRRFGQLTEEELREDAIQKLRDIAMGIDADENFPPNSLGAIRQVLAEYDNTGSVPELSSVFNTALTIAREENRQNFARPGSFDSALFRDRETRRLNSLYEENPDDFFAEAADTFGLLPEEAEGLAAADRTGVQSAPELIESLVEYQTDYQERRIMPRLISDGGDPGITRWLAGDLPFDFLTDAEKTEVRADMLKMIEQDMMQNGGPATVQLFRNGEPLDYVLTEGPDGIFRPPPDAPLFLRKKFGLLTEEEIISQAVEQVRDSVGLGPTRPVDMERMIRDVNLIRPNRFQEIKEFLREYDETGVVPDNYRGFIGEHVRQLTEANDRAQRRIRSPNEAGVQLERIGVDVGDIDPSGPREVRWEEYSLPGRENYRELRLALPGAKRFSENVHFPLENNNIFHARLSDRVDANTGERFLYVEELQNDWARDLRRLGEYSPEKMVEVDTRATQALATLQEKLREVSKAEEEFRKTRPSQEVDDLIEVNDLEGLLDVAASLRFYDQFETKPYYRRLNLSDDTNGPVKNPEFTFDPELADFGPSVQLRDLVTLGKAVNDLNRRVEARAKTDYIADRQKVLLDPAKRPRALAEAVRNQDPLLYSELRAKLPGLRGQGDLPPGAIENDIAPIMQRLNIPGDILPTESERGFLARLLRQNRRRLTEDEIAVFEKYKELPDIPDALLPDFEAALNEALSERRGFMPDYQLFQAEAARELTANTALLDPYKKKARARIDSQLQDFGLDFDFIDQMERTLRAYDPDLADALMRRVEMKDAPKPGPFVDNPKAWNNLAIGRLLKLAADEGYAGVAFTPLNVQLGRWSKQYDYFGKLTPNAINDADFVLRDANGKIIGVPDDVITKNLRVQYDTHIPSAIRAVTGTDPSEVTVKLPFKEYAEEQMPGEFTGPAIRFDDVTTGGKTIREKVNEGLPMYSIPIAVTGAGLAGMAAPDYAEAEEIPIDEGIGTLPTLRMEESRNTPGILGL